MQSMKTPREIIDRAGGTLAVAMRLDTTAANVRNQASKGILPAQWFALLEDMTGQTLPRQLFSFKGLSH
jgi:hypothetical protein